MPPIYIHTYSGDSISLKDRQGLFVGPSWLTDLPNPSPNHFPSLVCVTKMLKSVISDEQPVSHEFLMPILVNQSLFINWRAVSVKASIASAYVNRIAITWKSTVTIGIELYKSMLPLSCSLGFITFSGKTTMSVSIHIVFHSHRRNLAVIRVYLTSVPWLRIST